MPGSYYSDVERTIYLTYYILMEDIAKYNELFQQVTSSFVDSSAI